MFVNEVTSVVSFITWEPQVLGIDFQSRVPWLQPLINLQNRCFWLVLILFWFDCRACFFGVFSLLLIFESLSGYFRLFLVFPSLSLHALHVSVSFFFFFVFEAHTVCLGSSWRAPGSSWGLQYSCLIQVQLFPLRSDILNKLNWWSMLSICLLHVKYIK